MGLSACLLGGLLLFWGSLRQGDASLAAAFYTGRSLLTQGIVGAGIGFCALGAVIAFFGILNTFLTVFAAFSSFMITIGVAEVILVLGVMNGFQNDLRTKIIETHAHVVVEPAAQGQLLQNDPDLLTRIAAVPGVVGASRILKTEVMLSSQTGLAAVVLQGIDETIFQTSKLKSHLEKGKGTLEMLKDPEKLDQALVKSAGLEDEPWVKDRKTQEKQKPEAPAQDLGEMAFPMPAAAKAAPPPSIFLGTELKRNLALWWGESVNVVSPLGELGPQGPMPKSRPFRMAGWFESGMLEFDSKLAYVDLKALQRYLGVDDRISSIEVRAVRLEDARPLRDRLQAALGSEFRVTDWQERNHNLFSALELEKIAMFMVLTINILLAAFSIIGTLVMTIVERKREIAILMAMGSSSASILRIFISQGLFTGIVGCICGAAIGLGGGALLAHLGLPMNTDVYYIDSIPVDVRAFDVIAILTVALIVSIVSTLYPARYASKLRPVEGLYCE